MAQKMNVAHNLMNRFTNLSSFKSPDECLPTIHTILKNNGYTTHFIKKQFKDYLHLNQKDKTFLEGKQSEKRDETKTYP